MTDAKDPVVGDSFKMGFRFQNYWGTSIATAFFFAEIGAGLFLLSLYLGNLLGMVLGLLVEGLLKPYFHLAHMGSPKRVLRALSRPDRAWISRGSLGFGLMMAGGVVSVGAHPAVLNLSHPIVMGAAVVGAVGALIVMVYQGLAMMDSRAIALWTSPFLPIISFCYSITSGCLVLLALGWAGLDAPHRELLRDAAMITLILDAVMIGGIILTARNRSPGGAFSADLLVSGPYARLFHGLVLVVGLLVPLILLAAAGHWHFVTVLAALAMLVGFYTFRWLMLRAGVYEPVGRGLLESLNLG
ncbi:MAG: polysulfide reductase NrfD [Burkholderiaceae bacterium]|jgi:formate-dependent nitrite reductase membrane component NrfD|nr:polysulfide reductase NrfD [Burkholderiaceae bacterium]